MRTSFTVAAASILKYYPASTSWRDDHSVRNDKYLKKIFIRYLSLQAHWWFRCLSRWHYQRALVSNVISNFQYVKDVRINGKLCTKWTYEINVREKKNSYEFYVTKTVPPLPVRLVMNGYDTLLVSYYDSYVIDYRTFKKWKYDEKKFTIPTCEYGNIYYIHRN